jgi:hypothetical protein
MVLGGTELVVVACDVFDVVMTVDFSAGTGRMFRSSGLD